MFIWDYLSETLALCLDSHLIEGRNLNSFCLLIRGPWAVIVVVYIITSFCNVVLFFLSVLLLSAHLLFVLCIKP